MFNLPEDLRKKLALVDQGVETLDAILNEIKQINLSLGNSPNETKNEIKPETTLSFEALCTDRVVKHPDQAYSALSYSQFGEDIVIISMFANMGIDHPTYLDIGAHHPYNISNTALLYNLGCRGINIEPSTDLYSLFLKHRLEDINLNIGVSDQKGTLTYYQFHPLSGRNTFSKETAEKFLKEIDLPQPETYEVAVNTVNNILDTYYEGKCPDFLSIDVEGLDDVILKSID
ncbi:MAG: FkbM family methyltransferase, partial [Victivallaceae bacterium]|nr:FkbM family methyltransferase [Victivallaceae bacterium]